MIKKAAKAITEIILLRLTIISTLIGFFKLDFRKNLKHHKILFIKTVIAALKYK